MKIMIVRKKNMFFKKISDSVLKMENIFAKKETLVAQSVKNPPAMGLITGLGGSPGGENGQPTPVFLPGEFPWTEEPGRLLPKGSPRVGHYG